MMRRFGSVVVAAVLVVGAGLGTARPGLAAPVPPSGGGSVASVPVGGAGLSVEEAQAVAAARAQGTEVEVASQGSESRKMIATPQGGLRLELTSAPSRVRTATGWADKDATLSRAAGRVRPKRLAASVSFADGGSSRLAEVGDGVSSLALSWPAGLPAPSLTEEFAVYRDVAPGLDVVAQAREGSASTFFVVKDARAAARIARGGIDLGLSLSQGLSARPAASHGGVEVVNATGAVVFVLPQFMAWDQAHLHTSDPVQAVQTGIEEYRVKVPASLPAGGLHLAPEASWLTDPARVFPLVIDPSPVMTSRWKTFNSIGETAFYPADEAYVGYQGWPGSTPAVFRTMMNFDVGDFGGKQITGSTLVMRQVHSPNDACNVNSWGPDVQVWATDAVGPNVSWGSQPTWWNMQATDGHARGNRTTCPGAANDIDQTWDTRGYITWAAGQHAGTVGLGLRSANEGDRNGWRRYRVVAGSYPKLTVTFNTAPSWSEHSTDKELAPLDDPARPWSDERHAFLWHTAGQVKDGAQGVWFWVSGSDPDAGDSIHAVARVSGPGGYATDVRADSNWVVSGGRSWIWIPFAAGRGVYRVDLALVDRFGAGAPAGDNGWLPNEIVYDDRAPSVPVVTSIQPADPGVGDLVTLLVEPGPALSPLPGDTLQRVPSAKELEWTLDDGARQRVPMTGCTFNAYGQPQVGCTPTATVTFRAPAPGPFPFTVKAMHPYQGPSSDQYKTTVTVSPGRITPLVRFPLTQATTGTSSIPTGQTLQPALDAAMFSTDWNRRGLVLGRLPAGSTSYARTGMTGGGMSFSVGANVSGTQGCVAAVCEVVSADTSQGPLSIGVGQADGVPTVFVRVADDPWVSTRLKVSSTATKVVATWNAKTRSVGVLVGADEAATVLTSPGGWAGDVTGVTVHGGTDPYYADAVVSGLNLALGVVTKDLTGAFFTSTQGA